MLKIYQLFTVLGLLLFSSSFAHSEKCASALMHDQLISQQNGFAEKVASNERQIQSIIARKKRSKTVEDVLTIPIVVHVIHTGEAIGVGHNISEEQVTSGIQQLNDAYRNQNGMGVDLKVEFKLAELDPNCSTTNGIIRVDGSILSGYSSDGVMLNSAGAEEVAVKDLSRWSNSDYYNIWLVSEFDGNNGGGGTQGFAYFPGAGSSIDGSMIMNSAWGNTGTVNLWNNQGSTAIHEIGHALNLYHTFEGDGSGSDCPSGTCGTGEGDCCDDTAPHMRSNSTCDSLGTNTCTGLQNDDVIQNYMDYSTQDCQVKFTADQKARMRAALEGPRGSLLLSKALNTSLSGFVAPIAAACTPVTDADGLGGGFSGIMLAEITGVVSHASSNTRNDEGYVDHSGSCIKTAILTKGATYQFKTNIWFNSGQAVAWIDYDNNGVFDSNEKIYDASIAGSTDDSASFSVPGTATINSYLRMRVLCDVSNPINSACHNPQYGQAEDYPVLIENTTDAVNARSTLSDVQLAPNPFNDKISIINNKGPVSYSIIDITGRLVQSGSITGSEDINTSNVPNGIYSVIIQSLEDNSTHKMIK